MKGNEASAAKDIAATSAHFLLPAIIYLAAIAVGIALWIFFPLPWFGSPLSDILFAVGWLAIVAVVAIDLSAVRALTRVKPDRRAAHLVIDGPFSFTRNPIYLGNTLVMIGATLISGILWFALLGLVAAFITQKLVIEREEKQLGARFGKKYFDYAKRVRRWV